MNPKNSVSAQVVKLPVNPKNGKKSSPTDSSTGANQAKPTVTPIKSNLSPESKSIFGNSSRAQLVALAASVPLFSAMGYGAAKADFLGESETHTEGSAQHAASGAGHLELVDVSRTFASGSDLHPMLATSVSDDQAFQEAFDAAREELGPGNFFIWNGNLYGTFYQEEWEALTEDQQADYLEALPQENLPDFVEAFGLPPVLVVEDPALLPETVEVIDNSVLTFNEQGEPTLNDEQVEIITSFEDMTDSEKMELILKGFNPEQTAEESLSAIDGATEVTGEVIIEESAVIESTTDTENIIEPVDAGFEEFTGTMPADPDDTGLLTDNSSDLL